MFDDDADEIYLLDLLNSTPTVDGEQRDELDSARAAAAWLRDHGEPASPGSWPAVRQAREALQAVVRGDASPRSLASLLTAVSHRPSVSESGVEWTLDVPAGRRAAVRAVLAWDAAERNRPGRLRACANPDCTLFLIDRSKPNTARWCSMAVCGNRMKARRHYERARAR